MQIWPGQPYPLGATFDGVGTNFSVFSEVAERVELSLFDDRGKETRIDLPEMTALCWHGYVPDVRPGQRYRLSRPRSLGSGQRTLVQSEQGPPRSICQGARWRVDLERGRISVHVRRRGVIPKRSRQRALRSQGNRREPVFRLGERSPPQHTLAPDGRLRNTRQRLHEVSPGDSRGDQGHLRRDVASCRGEVPAAAWHYRRRVAPCAPVRAGLDARSRKA